MQPKWQKRETTKAHVECCLRHCNLLQLAVVKDSFSSFWGKYNQKYLRSAFNSPLNVTDTCC